MSCKLTIFHLIGTVQYAFTLYYLSNHFKIPKTDQFKMFHTFGGELRFLTNWNLIVQSIFFVLCLINDIIGSNEVQPKQAPLIRRVKDFYHAALGFPLALFVGVSFWGIYAIDRELVFPKAIDPFFPTWLNHVMHTNVVIFTVIELICSCRAYPSRKRGLTVNIVFMLTYLTWTFIIYGISGRWVYPIMEVLNWPQRFMFIGVMMVFALSLYFVGEVLNKLIWGKELSQNQSSKGTSSTKKKAKAT